MPLEQRVLGRLDWTGLDHLARRLGLEDRRLLREGIDAFPSLRRRLLDHDELREARNEKRSRFLEFLVRDVRQPFQYFFYVLLAQTSRVSRELLNQFRLRHQFCHSLFSFVYERSQSTLTAVNATNFALGQDLQCDVAI